MSSYTPTARIRVQLDHTTDPYTSLTRGDTGTVSFVDSLGTLHVKWDNGSTLGLVFGEDTWTVIETAHEEVTKLSHEIAIRLLPTLQDR